MLKAEGSGVDDGERLRGYWLLHEPEEHGFGKAGATKLKSARYQVGR